MFGVPCRVRAQLLDLTLRHPEVPQRLLRPLQVRVRHRDLVRIRGRLPTESVNGVERDEVPLGSDEQLGRVERRQDLVLPDQRPGGRAAHVADPRVDAGHERVGRVLVGRHAARRSQGARSRDALGQPQVDADRLLALGGHLHRSHGRRHAAVAPDGLAAPSARTGSRRIPQDGQSPGRSAAVLRVHRDRRRRRRSAAARGRWRAAGPSARRPRRTPRRRRERVRRSRRSSSSFRTGF